MVFDLLYLMALQYLMVYIDHDLTQYMHTILSFCLDAILFPNWESFSGSGRKGSAYFLLK